MEAIAGVLLSFLGGACLMFFVSNQEITKIKSDVISSNAELNSCQQTLDKKQTIIEGMLMNK